ncbi:hypothetical protein RN001_012492 [Aquatica leii]|uniref:Uncharacterized protein n=1 Tax=Aquatica leii TaxID=1421715 RepID=A0AAN7NYI8_9COLE|nr:hypothetical protein RN001_012492 [Aquatica leii]
MNFNALIFLMFLKCGNIIGTIDSEVQCVGKQYKNVSLAAYFPSPQDDDDKTYRDMKGKKLRSLQEYLNDRSDFVSLAMDERLGIAYGTKVCIPELNKYFGYYLNFEVRDNGTDLLGMGYRRADIFVRTEMDSYDSIVNKKVTLIFVK